jgi:drug/metabolite transporter (DMT)-like permease
VALRLFFGALTITAIAVAVRADLRPPRRAVLTMLLLSLINTVFPFLLITWGEVTISSGLAAVLNSTTPIFSLLIAHLALHDERITVPRLVGVVVGFLGVLLLLSRDLQHGSVHWQAVVGQAAVVLASVCYALAAVLTRRTLRDLPSLTIATYALWFSAAISIGLSLLFSPPPLSSMGGQSLFAVAWLGILGSGIAYIFYYFIIQSWGASRATLVTYVVPGIGLVLGAIFLSETVDWRIVAGSALVILGVGLASVVRRSSRRAAEREPAPEPAPS